MNTETKPTVEMEEITINTDVLVIGGGPTGLKAGAEITESGYKVTLVEKTDTITPEDTSFEVLTGTCLVDNRGIPGDFTARLEKKGEIIERKVGAIVVATDACYEPLNEDYSLTLADNVVAQSELEASLGSNADDFDKKTVAFVTGFYRESNPLALERILNSALILQEQGCTVYVYVNNIKVAADGLDRLYKEVRDNGGTYFKLETPPEITQDGADLTITFEDPVLRRSMDLSPDLIVVEEAILPDDLNEGLAEILRIHTGPLGLLQKNNVHRFPVLSNREGIFVIGSARQTCGLSAALADAGNVALEVENLLGNGKRTAAKDQAVVDRDKCVICLTCYRCCPHGAIYWDNRAIISPVACQGCGICASECPMDAIQLGDFKDEEMQKAVKESVVAKSDEPDIVAFCCRNSALEAAEMASEFKMTLPAGLHMIEVPCAGKIDIDFIMNAFVEGADGVIVMACHAGNCKSEQGNTYAKWRVADAHRMMTETGFETERLQFVTLASNMGSEFSSIMADMEKTLKELGPSPLK